MSLFTARRMQPSLQLNYILSLLVLLLLLLTTIGYTYNTNNHSQDIRNDAQGNVIEVDTADNLQDKINESKENDILVLEVGTYDLESTLNISGKNLIFGGSGANFTNITSSADPIINIVNSKVGFEDLQLIGSGGTGIKVTGVSSEVYIDESIIDGNTKYAIEAEGDVEIKRSLISNNGGGVLNDAQLKIENTVFSSTVDSPALNIQSGKAIINNLIVRDSESTAINVESGDLELNNATIYNNESGIIQSNSSSGNLSITNTIVQGSKEEGINVTSSASVGYTNSFDNGTTNFSPTDLEDAAGNISVDSELISSFDLHLQNSSPLIDAGTPTSTDKDGSRVDIGAYGGQVRFLGDANSKPTILSSAPAEVLKPRQRFAYTIEATDPDKDELSYTVINTDTPGFIAQSDNVFVGSPSITDIGFYALMVVVSDGNGNNILHPISINVIPDTSKIVPTSTPTPTAPTATPRPTTVPTPTQEPDKAPDSIITFTSPLQDTTLTQENNVISWTIDSGTDIDSINLRYSANGTNFTDIATLSGDETSYVWEDITDLSNGRYILEIEIIDEEGTKIKKRSEQFNIDISTSEENIQITNVSPLRDDNISNTTPNISVTFRPSVELDLEKTKLTVNSDEVPYEAGNTTISYKPQIPLQGNVVVNVSIVSNEGLEGTETWAFNVLVETTPPPTSTPEVQNTILGLNRTLGLLVLCIVVVVLVGVILFLILRLLRTIREEREGNLEAEFTEYYDDNDQLKHYSLNEKQEDNKLQQKQGISNSEQKQSKNNQLEDVPKEYLKQDIQGKDINVQSKDNDVRKRNKDQQESQDINVGLDYNKTADMNKRSNNNTSTISNDPVSLNSAQTNQVSPDITYENKPNEKLIDETQPVNSNEVQDSQYTERKSNTRNNMSEEEKYVAELKQKYNITEQDIKNYQKNVNNGEAEQK